MYYDIDGLCPSLDLDMGGYGFVIKLWPKFQGMVAGSDLDQQKADRVIQGLGRSWLDACGFDQMYDPDNYGHRREEKPPGPNAEPLYRPERDIRVSWGEWGLEHISVPGNACGLDIEKGTSAPPGGRVLLPHNVDHWGQVQLLLIAFTWFANTLSLTTDQKATNHDTWRHIHRVRQLLNRCVRELLKRGEEHDQSKLESPEVEAFAEHGPALSGLTYGSEEYKAHLEAMRPALEHHYANNRHHPEFHERGVNGMNLVDVLEMLCDWKAASERHDDGSLRRSIEINAERFGIEPQLVEILRNTADLLDGE